MKLYYLPIILLFLCCEAQELIQTAEPIESLAKDIPPAEEDVSKSFDPVVPAGQYDCRILAETGMASVHLENSGPPMAYAENKPGFWFGIEILSESKTKFSVREVPTDLRPINNQDLEFGTFPSVLMEEYLYTGSEYQAKSRLDFIQFYGLDSPYKFRQAGFIYPGGEDTVYVTRFGECLARRQ